MESSEVVSLTLRRTHVWGAAGVAVGLVLGFGASRLLDRGAGSAGQGVGPAPTAVAAPAAGPPVPAPVPVSIAIPTERRPARGSSVARVTVVEFTDYGCPFCRQHATQTLEPLVRRFGNRIRYVVLNFPIAQLHPDAPLAAEAAECAADQDRFWEYHDRLFSVETHDRASLKRFARDLGLDAARFDRCLDGGAKTRLVNDHISLGTAAGVTGTPAFIINGQLVEGAYPLESLAALIDAALK